jgi:hypothetical protein
MLTCMCLCAPAGVCVLCVCVSRPQALQGMRCSPSLADARRGVSYNQGQCNWDYTLRGSRITRNRVSCPRGICPVQGALF